MAWTYTREIARKGVHLLSLFFIVIYLLFSYWFGHLGGMLALIVLLMILIIFEFYRLDLKQGIPFISKFWWVKREKEKSRIGAEIFFLIGAIICFAVFDIRVAIAAILMTTFGDLAASLIGKKFGKHRLPYPKTKAWEGAFAELVVDVVVGFFVIRALDKGVILWMGGLGTGQPVWPVIIGMALTATVVETVVNNIEDNLVVPIFSGFAGQVILMILMSSF
jgi:dolichol kinase